jgi:cobalt-zinc-cadmium efflux system protein
MTDLWAFLATFAAGLVIALTRWERADAVASLLIAALMAWTGAGLVKAAGRVFLEAAPPGIDPDELGRRLVAVEGVMQIHDLHIWQLGSGSDALSAHVLVADPEDCHEVSARVRTVLADDYGIGHVTLQSEHAEDGVIEEQCADVHGRSHTSST